MGKFSNTEYANTIQNLVEATKSKLANPYYKFNDKHPTVVIYYSQNIEKSTLDQASGLYEAHVGNGSPFKFNKIENFVLYGIERITTEYDVGDNGIESNQITGNAYVLPNTITPRPGDFFSIPYIKEPVLFKVNSVSIDTLDTGANAYQIEYALELTNKIETINKQIDKTFRFIVGNSGTDFKTLLEDSDADLIDKIEGIVEELITIFYNVFFDERLQTFVYTHDGYHMYDPYFIEFAIRNRIFQFGDKYLFVSHATTTDKTFGMDYSRSFFHWLEQPDDATKYSTNATASLITDPNSLFVTRMHDYYKLKYWDSTPYATRFSTINQDVIEHIKNNALYEKGDKREYYNLWISFYNDNNDVIRGDIISMIKNMDYMDNMEYFYSLAISIFVLERYIGKLMS